MKDFKRCPDDLKRRYGKHWPEMFELSEWSWQAYVKSKKHKKLSLKEQKQLELRDA